MLARNKFEGEIAFLGMDEEDSLPPRPREFKSGIEQDLEEMRRKLEVQDRGLEEDTRNEEEKRQVDAQVPHQVQVNVEEPPINLTVKEVKDPVFDT